MEGWNRSSTVERTAPRKGALLSAFAGLLVLASGLAAFAPRNVQAATPLEAAPHAALLKVGLEDALRFFPENSCIFFHLRAEAALAQETGATLARTWMARSVLRQLERECGVGTHAVRDFSVAGSQDGEDQIYLVRTVAPFDVETMLRRDRPDEGYAPVRVGKRIMFDAAEPNADSPGRLGCSFCQLAPDLFVAGAAASLRKSLLRDAPLAVRPAVLRALRDLDYSQHVLVVADLESPNCRAGLKSIADDMRLPESFRDAASVAVWRMRCRDGGEIGGAVYLGSDEKARDLQQLLNFQVSLARTAGLFEEPSLAFLKTAKVRQVGDHIELNATLGAASLRAMFGEPDDVDYAAAP